MAPSSSSLTYHRLSSPPCLYPLLGHHQGRLHYPSRHPRPGNWNQGRKCKARRQGESNRQRLDPGNQIDIFGRQRFRAGIEPRNARVGPLRRCAVRSSQTRGEPGAYFFFLPVLLFRASNHPRHTTDNLHQERSAPWTRQAQNSLPARQSLSLVAFSRRSLQQREASNAGGPRSSMLSRCAPARLVPRALAPRARGLCLNPFTASPTRGHLNTRTKAPSLHSHWWAQPCMLMSEMIRGMQLTMAMFWKSKLTLNHSTRRARSLRAPRRACAGVPDR